MRTTVPLDPDVVDGLRALARSQNISFKAALNAAVRAGLGGEPGMAREYRLPARPMHLRPEIDLTHALRLAGELEDAENIRKLQRRK